MNLIEKIKLLDVENPDHIELLKELAEKALDHRLRYTALARLDANEHGDLIARIAKNDPVDIICTMAISKFSADRHADYLADIAKSNQREDVCTEAFSSFDASFNIDKYRRSDLFAAIAKNAQHAGIRREAIYYLDEDKYSDLVTDIAENDPDWKVRKTAVTKLYQNKYSEVVTRIAKNDQVDKVREIAIYRLAENKENHATLIDIVKQNIDNRIVCKAAIFALPLLDEFVDFYTYVIEKSPYLNIRQSATTRLHKLYSKNNPSKLNDLCKNDPETRLKKLKL
ncbi:hypothetical protein ACFL08_04135 [Patescibacteria group bacterium]